MKLGVKSGYGNNTGCFKITERADAVMQWCPTMIRVGFGKVWNSV